MNTYNAIEQSYKNGYNAGVREFAERLKEISERNSFMCYRVDRKDIDTIAEELTRKQESSKNDMPEIVLKVIELRQKGYTIKYIAKKIGYCERQIHRILKKCSRSAGIRAINEDKAE